MVAIAKFFGTTTKRLGIIDDWFKGADDLSLNREEDENENKSVFHI